MEVAEDKDEGGFVVSYPDLPGCITCGETVKSAGKMHRMLKRHGLRQHLKKEWRFMSRTVWKIIPDSIN